MIYYKTDKGILYQGNVLYELKTLTSNSVDCCITSPPYWGLRDYNTAPQIWDDTPRCEHVWGVELKKKNAHKAGETNPGLESYTKDSGQWSDSQGQFCQKCNAWKGSLGLEPTPQLYISHLVQIFNEVKRVLKPTGTLWVVIGDSYAGSGKAGSNPEYQKKHTQFGQKERKERLGVPIGAKNIGLKPKDLVGIPWMLGFALRDAGWWLRQDIIWAKGVSFCDNYSGSVMPESVQDRFCNSYEHILLLSRSQKYFFDLEAVKENSNNPTDDRKARANQDQKRVPNRLIAGVQQGSAQYVRRTPRSVWTINPQASREAHFAVFPPKLVELMIKAGCHKNDVVLDPFFGSGTTGLVAEQLGRNWIGIELSKDYCEMAKQRFIERKYGVKTTKQTEQAKGLLNWDDIDMEVR